MSGSVRGAVEQSIAPTRLIDVGESGAGRTAEVAKANLEGIEGERIILGAFRIEDVDVAISKATDLELVQVRVCPTHACLQDVMKLGERGPKGYDKAARNGYVATRPCSQPRPQKKRARR